MWPRGRTDKAELSHGERRLTTLPREQQLPVLCLVLSAPLFPEMAGLMLQNLAIRLGSCVSVLANVIKEGVKEVTYKTSP